MIKVDIESSHQQRKHTDTAQMNSSRLAGSRSATVCKSRMRGEIDESHRYSVEDGILHGRDSHNAFTSILSPLLFSAGSVYDARDHNGKFVGFDRLGDVHLEAGH